MEKKLYLGVTTDYEYKLIQITLANDEEEAKKNLTDEDGNYPQRIEKVNFKEDVSIIFNGR